MAKETVVTVRRGLETNRTGITPDEGELIYTTDDKEVWVGDGSTAGGILVTGGGGGGGSFTVGAGFPGSPSAGDGRVNTTDDRVYVWDGNAWIDISSAGGSDGADGVTAGIPMQFESLTTDVDQGNGKIWFNNATLASATVLYMDDLNNDGVNIEAQVLTWDDSTATISGTIILKQAADASIYATFNITGATTDATGYSKLVVTYVNGSGTFVDADLCSVEFSRSGDSGSEGSVSRARSINYYQGYI